MKYFEDERKTEMKGVLDLASLTACQMSNEPPELILCVGEGDGQLVLRAGDATDCRQWVKAFLSASPNCQVTFVKSNLPSALGAMKTAKTGSVGAAQAGSAKELAGEKTSGTNIGNGGPHAGEGVYKGSGTLPLDSSDEDSEAEDTDVSGQGESQGGPLTI